MKISSWSVHVPTTGGWVWNEIWFKMINNDYIVYTIEQKKRDYIKKHGK